MTTLITPFHNFPYEGVRLNIYHANQGEGLPKHEHEFAHATFCVAGSCVIRKEGKEVIFDKHTQPANLKANEWHEIEALEDGTIFVNVFADKQY